jgi:S-adenosylmethionine uptake transporter
MKMSIALPEGIGYMLLANLFFSLMGASVYEAKILDPLISPFFVSFVRVVVNLFVILLPALVRGKGKSLWGDKSCSLWLRGLFGGLALMLFFYSIQELGLPKSTFIQSASAGIVTVLLCPFFLKERFSPRALFAVLGSIVGLYLLFNRSFDGGGGYGQIVALVSGFFAGLSAIMVAKAGERNTKETIVWYFCFVALFAHFGYFAVKGIIIPHGYAIWAVMIATGLFSSAAQLLMTKAYQIAPASVVVVVGNTGPVLNIFWGIVLFEQLLTGRALIGCSIILFCGILMPFLKGKKEKACAVDIKEVL